MSDMNEKLKKAVDHAEKDALLRELARAISEAAEIIYNQEMAFFLCLSPFESGTAPLGIADYIGSASRETAILWLRDTADRLEARQDIGPTRGTA